MGVSKINGIKYINEKFANTLPDVAVRLHAKHECNNNTNDSMVWFVAPWLVDVPPIKCKVLNWNSPMTAKLKVIGFFTFNAKKRKRNALIESIYQGLNHDFFYTLEAAKEKQLFLRMVELFGSYNELVKTLE